MARKGAIGVLWLGAILVMAVLIFWLTQGPREGDTNRQEYFDREMVGGGTSDVVHPSPSRLSDSFFRDVLKSPKGGAVDSANALRVTIVGRGEDLSPEGWTIFVLDPELVAVEQFQRSSAPGRSFQDLFINHGKPFFVDQLGEVLIPEPPDRFHLAAKSDSGFTFVWNISQAKEEVRLRVEGSPIVNVVASTASGEAVENTPIYLIDRLKPRGHEIAAQGVSDSAGSVALSLGAIQEVENRLGDFYVEVGSISPHSPRRSLESLMFGVGRGEMNSLQLGRIQIQVVTPAGVPIKKVFQAKLSFPESREDATDGATTLGRSWNAQTNMSGVARFFPVALDSQISIAVKSLDGELSGVMRSFNPTTKNDKAIIKVIATLEDSMIVGRLVDSEGVPDKNRALRIIESIGHEGVARQHVSIIYTNKEGLFRLKPSRGTSGKSSHKISIFSAERKSAWEMVEMHLTLNLDSGENDIGDISLEAPKSYVSGVVVDPEMNPIAGAMIFVEESTGSSWSRWKHWAVESSSDGVFSIPLPISSGSFRAVAEKPGHGSGVAILGGGNQEIGFVLAPTLSCSGRFILDDGIDAQALEAVIIPIDAEASLKKRFSGLPLGDDGGFALEGFPASECRLQLRARETSIMLFEKTFDFSRAEGANISIPAIDLRGELFARQVEVMDEAGIPIQAANIHGHETTWPRLGPSRPIMVILRGPRPKLWASAPGYRTSSISDDDGLASVVLRRGIPSEFSLQSSVFVPVGYSMVATVSNAAPSPGFSEERIIVGIGSGRSAQHFFSAAGEYWVCLELWEEGISPGGRGPRKVEGVVGVLSRTLIQVAESNDIQKFSLPVLQSDVHLTLGNREASD